MLFRSLSKMAVTLTILTTLAAFVQAPMNAQDNRYSLTIHNTSGYHIYKIYMSSSKYDIKFVDQDGDACKLLKVKVFHNTSWNLTSQWLLGCEFGR